MRNLKYLLAAIAIGGLVALPQTSSAAAPHSKADDYGYYGVYYPYYGYYPGRRLRYHRPYYGYYPYRRYHRPYYGYYPYRRYHRPYYGGPFIGGPFITFGFGG